MFRLRRSSVCLVLFTIIMPPLCLTDAVQGEVTRDSQDFTIEGIKYPTGSEIEVIGPLLYKGRPDRSDVRGAVQGTWINGKANLNQVRFHLGSEKKGGWPTYQDIQALEREAFYKVRGQIVDGRIEEERTSIVLIVRHLEKIEPRPIMFADLVDRNTTFTGTAAENGTFVTEQGQAKLQGLEQWPQAVQGQQVFVRGTLRQQPNGFQIEQAIWHPADLELLVDKPVALEGTLWDENHPSFMKYEKEFLYLSFPPSRRAMFLQKYQHRRVPVRVSGTLVRESRPPLNWNGPDLEAPFQACYVIRDARVEYLLPADFEYDEYKAIYSRHPVSQGVPELVAEYPFPGNRQEDPSDAQDFVWRNEATIQSILTGTTLRTRNVLTERMQDPQQPAELRKIYAAMLAHLNDQRGRDYLLKSLEDRSPDAFDDTVFCLGTFPSLGTGKICRQTDLDWAEAAMVKLMSDQTLINISKFHGHDYPYGVHFVTVADAVMLYSEIPAIMVQINSAATRKALMDYQFSEVYHSRDSYRSLNLINTWLHSTASFTVQELSMLENKPTGSIGGGYDRKQILSRYLKLENYSVLQRFLQEKDSSEYYDALREQLTPELVQALKTLLPQLQGEAREMVELLLIVNEPDPVPLIIQKLEASAWESKNLALYELIRLQDRRAVTPLVRILHTAPSNYFTADSWHISDRALDRALNVIALAGPSREIHELIELLSVDLSRFVTHSDRAYYQQKIALRLINLTGVSCGVDQAAWRAWERAELMPISPEVHGLVGQP
ncbi:hypothetical protein [Gimesia chilikensis]|uniref:Uncharacterized protein n=1 Tax=Gimesia chilikensis TaxID=2605989 RepID=A0A517PG51_9PLAN|nr:hypothetical protein [Gimesia chilikensis]QDT18360.1 hypothetical protein HG66A1_01190 [Gimesia chilikensis]